ncbi:MAG: hypothetical protein FVQ81_15155 [Candidatus Glassbacteria bacterium]|nr:hypothetical protein [Candidatus Glassbacteria bacterium]
MSWIDSHLIQLMYWLDVISQLLPLVLTVAVIFTYFLVQGFARKLSKMEFYLDRIDNHLREVTYFIKEYQSGKGSGDESGEPREEDSPARHSGTQR